MARGVDKMYKMYRNIIAIAAVLLALPCAATYFGYGIQAWVTFVAIMTILYLIAPARKYPTAEEVSADVDMHGKVVLITGPTSGVGQETARVLAKRGAQVVLAARSAKKLEVAKKEIEASFDNSLLKPPITCLECDLDDLQSVRRCAQQFLAMKLPLDVLICNAGVMALPKRSSTKQGLEQQVGVNHVGHFLLVQLLLPALEQAKSSRVVVLSSSAHRLTDSAYLQEPKLETNPYEPWTAYGNSKVSNCLFAKELNARYKSKGVTAFSVHPGGIHTGLQGNVDKTIALAWLIVTPFAFKSIPQGAATTVICATKAGLEEHGGKYFDNCAPTDVAETMAKKMSEEIGMDAPKKLWDATEQMLKGL